MKSLIMKISAVKSTLLVIDIQEKLLPKINQQEELLLGLTRIDYQIYSVAKWQFLNILYEFSANSRLSILLRTTCIFIASKSFLSSKWFIALIL